MIVFSSADKDTLPAAGKGNEFYEREFLRIKDSGTFQDRASGYHRNTRILHPPE